MKKILIIGALLLAGLLGWYFYPQTVDMLFGSDSGALSPGTMANDASVGTQAWAGADNAKASDNVRTTAKIGNNSI